MPVNYPNVPANELNVKERIIKKYMEYIKVYNRDGNTIRTQGERYEIVSAIFLYRAGKLTNGNQLSRWNLVQANQSISLGANTEYDFIIPGTGQFPNFPQIVVPVAGVLLGEAKSYYTRITEYIKKATGYCLWDPQNLCGFCFITPGNQVNIWRQVLRNVYTILSDPQQTPGICGGPGWQRRESVAGKPNGVAVRDYFQQYQDANLLQGRLHTLALTITQELITHAGFFVVAYRVPSVTHDQVRDLVGNLP